MVGSGSGGLSPQQQRPLPQHGPVVGRPGPSMHHQPFHSGSQQPLPPPHQQSQQPRSHQYQSAPPLAGGMYPSMRGPPHGDAYRHQAPPAALHPPLHGHEPRGHWHPGGRSEWRDPHGGGSGGWSAPPQGGPVAGAAVGAGDGDGYHQAVDALQRAEAELRSGRLPRARHERLVVVAEQLRREVDEWHRRGPHPVHVRAPAVGGGEDPRGHRGGAPAFAMPPPRLPGPMPALPADLRPAAGQPTDRRLSANSIFQKLLNSGGSRGQGRRQS